MKIDLKELGKRIKLTRKGQDLTQEMLAEKAGVSQHYIYEIEAGRKAMSIHSFASLTTALDVVNVNIKMIKKWKIKMYIFQDLFLSLCFHKGSFFF